MPALDTLAIRYAWVLVLCGVLGVALGINRTIKRREKESLFLQWLSAIGGIAVLATPTAMVLHLTQRGVYTSATVLLMIVLSLCLLARPLKKIPIAFTVVTAAGVGLLWAAMKFRGTSLGGRIPIELLIAAMAIVLVGLFILCFTVEAAVDTVLAILGWGLVVTIISAIAVIHGVLIAKGVGGAQGLQFLFR